MAVESNGRTSRQRSGDEAERVVAERLSGLGWVVLGRDVHAGRSELDIVAIDPGPPRRLSIVEVRFRSSRSFGLPEESFDRRKRRHVIEGIGRLLESGSLPDGTALPKLPIGLDLAVVEPSPAGLRIRLYRDATA